MKSGLFSVGSSLKEGWALTKRHFIVMLGLLLGFFVFSFLLSMLGGSNTMSVRYWVVWFVSLVVSLIFEIGYMKLFLNAIDGEEPRFSVFSDVLNKMVLFPYLGLKVLLSIFFLVVFLVVWGVGLLASPSFRNIFTVLDSMNMPFGDMSAVSEWIGVFDAPAFLISSVVGVLLMLYLAVRLFAAPLLLIDRGIGIIESIRMSFRITRGNEWKIVGLYLLCLLINLLGICALIVGVVVTIILSYFAIMVAYRQIVEGNDPKPVDEGFEQV